MMRGVAGTLERHHGVAVLDEGIEEAVRLSRRYITDRQLPDKSVSLLDTACARVNLSQSTTPAGIEDARRDIEHTNTAIAILEREQALGVDHTAKVGEFRERLEKAKAR